MCANASHRKLAVVSIPYIETVASLLPAGWRCEPSGSFFIEIFPANAKEEFPEQGWKVRVNNACTLTFVPMLRTILEICFVTGISVKTATGENQLRRIYSKELPVSVAGKALTLYLPSECRSAFVSLIEKLRKSLAPLALAPCNAPLSDRKIDDNLSYRYGAFSEKSHIRTPYGNFKDRRDIYLLPTGIVDPFPEEEDESTFPFTDVVNLNGYEISSVIHRNWGGSVYSGKTEIVKEARPNAKIGCIIDATTLLKNEHCLLESIHREHKNIVPRPIDLFEVDEHLFLVTERISGRTLYEWSWINSPSPSDCVAIARQIAAILNVLHQEMKTAHLDLSLSNIIISEDGTLFLIDFENARQEADSEAFAEDSKQFAELLISLWKVKKPSIMPHRYKDAIQLAEQGQPMIAILDCLEL